MREIGFLKFNKDNLMKHLLAIEDHARYLKEGMSPEHYACITKHFLQAEEQSDEGISHASVIEPENLEIFKDVKNKLFEMRNKMTNNTSPENVITAIREIRKIAEKLDPSYNTSECKVCGSVEESLKGLNRGDNQNSIKKKLYIMEDNNMSENKKVVVNTLVGNIVGKFATKGTAMIIPGATMGISNKTLANVGIGVLLSGAALYGKLKKANTIAAVIGTSMIAEELVNIGMGAMATAPPAPSPAPSASMGAVYNGGLYATTYSNGSTGGLVSVD